MNHTPIRSSDNAYLGDLWSSPEARTAKEQVQALLETEGWKRLEEAIDARLRHEQLLAMRESPKEEARYDRSIGKWSGLQSLRGIAEGIIENGETAEARQAA